jgi:hypothetical protein
MREIWRFEVRLRSREALVGLMAVQGLSIRQLAARCDPKKPDRYRSAIGHLVSGKRDTISPHAAAAIQKVLAPNNDKARLFDGEVYSVTQDGGTPPFTPRRAAA